MPSISKAIAAMDKACRVWSLGYDQGNRWDIRDGGECDCSSLVIWALKQGGFDTGDATYTGNLSANLTARGWKRLPPDLSILQPGDILLNDTHHVCMVVRGHGRDAIIAQASIDERGKASGGRGGDQTGGETNEREVYVYRHGWDCILRYTGAVSTQPTGWIQKDGRWWYRHADGSYTTIGWEKIDGKWYLFDADGWMLTGWQQVGGKWYYLTDSGAMATGWVNDGGKWYYMDQDTGAMHAADVESIGGKWYAFGADGEMQYGVGSDASGALKV